MGKLWRLIKANARKDKGQLILFFLILTLAGLLLHTALIVGNYESMYDERVEKRRVPTAICYGIFDREELQNALNQQQKIGSYWLKEIMMPGTMRVKTSASKKEKEVDDFVILEKREDDYERTLNFLERDDSVSGEKLYLNLYSARNLGVSVGDTMTMDSDYFGEKEYTVAGIYEDLLMGSSFSYYSLLIEPKCYQEFEEIDNRLMEEKHITFRRDLAGIFFLDEEMTNAEWEEIGRLDHSGHGGWDNSDAFRAGYISVVNILAAFMAAFAVIIILVTVTTIAFTIRNNIDKDIRNIGALRAVGHTTAQLRWSIIEEFSILAFYATITGIGLSFFLYPMVERAFIQEQTGMKWEGSLEPLHVLLLLAFVLGSIALITFLSTRRIGHLSPATALRFGLSSNSFRRNHLPLSETRGGLNVLLALKSCLQAGGQNLTVFFAMLLVSFVATFAAQLYYNTQVDVTRFQHLIQGDVPDAMVYFEGQDQTELAGIREKLFTIEGVKQVYGLGSTSGHAGEETATILYSNSCKDVYCGLYAGTMALEDNEAVIAGGLAEKLGVSVGDEIEVGFGEESAKYLVTGLQQAVYGMGMRIYLTDGGAQRIGIETPYSYFRIRLENPSADEVDRVLLKARELLGEQCTDVENYYRYQRSMDNMPVMAVSFIVLLLVILSGLIAILVLSLIIKNVFVKREKEFGIKKALGFTSSQLRLQLALSLAAVVILSAVLGAALGYLLTNPLITLIFWGFGIKKAELYVCVHVALIAACLVVLFTILISFLAARRMKKVSAYELIQE